MINFHETHCTLCQKTGISVDEGDLSLERPSPVKDSYARRVAEQSRRQARQLNEQERKHPNGDDVLSAGSGDEEDRVTKRRVRFVDEVS